MKTKTFEIRDRGTFIPALAVKLRSDGIKEDRYLLRRAGLDSDGSYHILLTNLQNGESHYDRYKWNGFPVVRTLPVAHEYIEKHFDELETGTVIDVEFILGETTEIKKSEKFTAFGLDE
jgi:hypothetical protein